MLLHLAFVILYFFAFPLLVCLFPFLFSRCFALEVFSESINKVDMMSSTFFFFFFRTSQNIFATLSVYFFFSCRPPIHVYVPLECDRVFAWKIYAWNNINCWVSSFWHIVFINVDSGSYLWAGKETKQNTDFHRIGRWSFCRKTVSGISSFNIYFFRLLFFTRLRRVVSLDCRYKISSIVIANIFDRYRLNLLGHQMCNYYSPVGVFCFAFSKFSIITVSIFMTLFSLASWTVGCRLPYRYYFLFFPGSKPYRFNETTEFSLWTCVQSIHLLLLFSFYAFMAVAVCHIFPCRFCLLLYSLLLFVFVSFCLY